MNGKDGPQNPNLDCDPGGSCWYIVVANIDEYLKSPLTYTLRVSCRDEPACPSNTLRPDGSISPVCGGVGECRVTDQACGGLNSCTSCACPSGFGGRGCEVQLPVRAYVPALSSAMSSCVHACAHMMPFISHRNSWAPATSFLVLLGSKILCVCGGGGLWYVGVWVWYVVVCTCACACTRRGRRPAGLHARAHWNT